MIGDLGAIVQAIITLVGYGLLFYVAYKFVRLADILDVVRNKYATQAQIDLHLTKMLAKKYIYLAELTAIITQADLLLFL